MFMRRIVLAAVVAAPLAWAPAPAAAAPLPAMAPQSGNVKKAMPEKRADRPLPPGIANNYPHDELPPGIAAKYDPEPAEEPAQEEEQPTEEVADTTNTEECTPVLVPGEPISLDCSG